MENEDDSLSQDDPTVVNDDDQSVHDNATVEDAPTDTNETPATNTGSFQQQGDTNDDSDSQGVTVNRVTQSQTQHDDDHSANDTPIKVNSISQQEFRNQLVEHFAILHSRNKIDWPKQKGIGDEPDCSIPVGVSCLMER